MPQLTIRGIDPQIVKDTNLALVKDLAEVMSCPVDYFTVDLLTSLSFENGQQAPTFPFIQVGWFDRGQEVKNASAKVIDKHFKAAGVGALEVVFVAFEEKSYYADGEHY